MSVRVIFISFCLQLSLDVAFAANKAASIQGDSSIQSSIHQLEAKYNISIHIYHRGDTTLQMEKNVKGDSVVRDGYSFKTISPYQSILIERFTNILYKELNKYPVDFIEGSGLKEIAFVANLRVGRQRRVAMPDAGTHTLYFDVNYPGAREEYCSHAIHHEFFHLLAYEIYGSFYYHDAEWTSFNPPYFRYKGGGGFAYGNYEVFKKQKPSSGFITPYATYGMEEDMAEVFASLMTRTGFPIVTYWMQVDAQLLNKTNFILGIMSSRSPGFDLSYLRKLHEE